MQYLVNETAIVAENDRHISSSGSLRDHVGMINAALHFLDDFGRLRRHTDDVEKNVLILGMRLFNSAAGALRLARGGYYQQAFMLVRDLVETGLLLELFVADRQAVQDWTSADQNTRESRFKPVKVREWLEKLDGAAPRDRRAFYKLLSGYAVHVTPDGFILMAQNGMVMRGPFPDAGRITAAVEDIVKSLSAGAALLATWFEGKGGEGDASLQAFWPAWSAWKERYLPAGI